jgi:hypothetical protein
MNKYTYILFLVLLVSTSVALGQKAISNKFKFEDGVYLKHADLRSNQPSQPLFKIPNFDYQLDKDGNLLFLSDKSMAKLSESEIKSIDNIWGICINGKPYMKIKPTADANEVYFVRYYIMGRICYLYYPIFEEKTVQMYVYNPYTGHKMGSKPIVNKEKKFIKKLMLFETGELQDYTPQNFMKLIESDKKLLASLKDLTEEETENKLFKSIKIYNDRNPILATK